MKSLRPAGKNLTFKFVCTILFGSGFGECIFWSGKISIAETNLLRHQSLINTGNFQVCYHNEFNDAEFDVIIDAYGGAVTQKMTTDRVKAGGVIVNFGLAGGDAGLDVRE